MHNTRNSGAIWSAPSQMNVTSPDWPQPACSCDWQQICNVACHVRSLGPSSDGHSCATHATTTSMLCAACDTTIGASAHKPRLRRKGIRCDDHTPILLILIPRLSVPGPLSPTRSLPPTRSKLIMTLLNLALALLCPQNLATLASSLSQLLTWYGLCAGLPGTVGTGCVVPNVVSIWNSGIVCTRLLS